MIREDAMNQGQRASRPQSQKSRAKCADEPAHHYVAFCHFDIGLQVRASMESLTRSYDLLDATAWQAERGA